MDLTICVATYGDNGWRRLAHTRAVPSARAEGVSVVHIHGATLHDARNAALSEVVTPWVVHLDADDEVEPGYVAAMAGGTADVRVPAVRYIRRGNRAAEPRMLCVAGHAHACAAECLPIGNWIVVGAAVRTELVRAVGGWRDFDWSEDWDLWLRLYLAGATVEAVPQAIYRAHVRAGSRNRSASRAAQLRAHRAIAAANGVPSP